ncbi:glutamine cyclotransferase [Parvularcula bermudensis HTCC2503]|uniref:Glutamine cyclotransferase n=1 Tax=Parvularcula bermudensis (strain ATCC BAA-594 / HTCC2503 / KCTC 12087) TaxID=314260 RepID=E0TI48_PARBH|nr:glutaminyl-peptide cyclotransferase [Parvularcula bermudensis]ADM09387.1 glutamine cyclotransferase [Parvularcula bermudensis HTCC2503]
MISAPAFFGLLAFLFTGAQSAEGALAAGEAPPVRPTVSTVEVVAVHPHGRRDFTQGLFFADGVLYESTGRVGQSALIRHGLGEVEAKRHPLPETVFGEGSTAVGDHIVSLTWRSGIGFVHDRESFDLKSRFPIDGEGWGLTYDGDRLILSDGSDRLRFLDPTTFAPIGSLAVTLNGRPLTRLNELEWVEGEIWANIWLTDFIARIDPATGIATGLVDLRGLEPDRRDPNDDVLNGIAYDEENGRLMVTGKNWAHLYEIKVLPSD